MEQNLFVGVDIGGTKVAAGLVNSQGEILRIDRVPMVSGRSAENGLESVFSAITRVAPDPGQQMKGIGICAPGPLDPKTGVILNPPNVPCWRNFPLAQAVQRQYAVPVKVDNDANAAALAETRWGAAQGYKVVFYATIGTGIGTGIVFDDKIYHGRTGSAAEGGHVSIDYRGPLCRCGKPGCIEVLASGPAVATRAWERIAAGCSSSLSALAGERGDGLTGEIIAQAFAAGDNLAREILTESVAMLALWFSNMIDLIDPEVIVIGGGAAALYRPFFDLLKQTIPKLSVNPHASEVRILSARYGPDSGIAGGAALCA